MTGFVGREVHLVRRPVGRPCPDDVALVEAPVPDPEPGQVVVRNQVMSVEPYMRGRMSEQRSYVLPYQLHAPMAGHAVGEVVASADPSVPEGAIVVHELGWREFAIVGTGDVEMVRPDGISPSTFLGALGIPGMTAWVGLTRIIGLRSNEAVLISSAAGAVGAVAGQIAHATGATVIGSCGSPAKVARCTGEFGYDVAFDYHDGPIRDLLKKALAEVGRDGIDAYFDNVGGEQLEAAIRACRERARIALCGAIAVYNATEPPPGPRNLLLMIWRRLRMEGFLVGDHRDALEEFRHQMTGWLRDGVVRDPQVVVGRGIEEAFSGFLAMLDGSGAGKAVVTL